MDISKDRYLLTEEEMIYHGQMEEYMKYLQNSLGNITVILFEIISCQCFL